MTNVDGKNKLIQTHGSLKMLQFDLCKTEACFFKYQKYDEIIDVLHEFSFQTFW